MGVAGCCHVKRGLQGLLDVQAPAVRAGEEKFGFPEGYAGAACGCELLAP